MQCWSHASLPLPSCWLLIERLGFSCHLNLPIARSSGYQSRSKPIPSQLFFFLISNYSSSCWVSLGYCHTDLHFPRCWSHSCSTLSQSEDVQLPDVLRAPSSVGDIFLWMCPEFIHAVMTLKYVGHDSWLLPKVHVELRVGLTLWPTHWDMLEDDSLYSFLARHWLFLRTTDMQCQGNRLEHNSVF